MNKSVLFAFLCVASPSFSAIDFTDATNERINACATCGPTGARPRTVAFWINADAFDTATNDSIVGGAAAANGGQFAIFAEDNAISVGFQGHRIISPKSALATGVWYHVAVVVPDGATTTDQVKIYTEGVNRTTSLEAGSAQTLNTTVTGITMGNAVAGGSLGFNGKLDDFRFYTRALTDKEIEQLSTSRSKLVSTEALLLWMKLDEGIEGQAAGGTGTIIDSGPSKSNGDVVGSPVWFRSPIMSP